MSRLLAGPYAFESAIFHVFTLSPGRSEPSIPDGSRRNTVLFILIIGFLGLWFAWFMAGRVAVYASTGAAGLEVARENHPVDAPVEGRVEAVRVVVGQWVQAGDVLLEFDASSERLARQD